MDEVHIMIYDTKENIELLAKFFYDKLCTKLTAEQIDKIKNFHDNNNACDIYGVCEGICDPNDLMIEVFKKVFDETFDSSNKIHKKLYDVAWLKILNHPSSSV
jgi:hypothetical protein